MAETAKEFLENQDFFSRKGLGSTNPTKILIPRVFAPAGVPFFKYYKRVGPKRGQIVKFLKAFSKIRCPAGGKPGGKSKQARGKH